MNPNWYFPDSSGGGSGTLQSEVVALEVSSDMRNISYSAVGISSYIAKAVDVEGNPSGEIFLNSSDVKNNGTTTITVEWNVSFVGVIQLILFY